MSLNKSKIPLDKEFLPKPSMSVKTIDMNQRIEEAPIPTGVKLVEAVELEQLQISEEDLKMAATANISDISDFGEFMPTQIVALEDATEFPILAGNEAIISDSEKPEEK